MEKNDNRSLTEHRRRLILERVRELGAVRTSELARIHSVSPMTIRNDLDALARRGHLLRVHGGAMVKEQLAAEPSYHEKASLNLEEKRRIGRRAAALIEDGMAVFIGNGTTTMEIVRALKDRAPSHVKAFTNALTHATELAGIPQVDLYVVGGYLRGVSFAMVGPLASQALEGVYFDLAFLGANGISLEHGITIPSLEEAETAAEIVRHARRVVIVADHTKFGVVTHGRIADLEEVDVIVTDEGLDPQYARLLSEQGGELVLA
ncbi:MAG: DeoR/GlpR family DNA-binding transcription regulator [Candidatus Acetothermia bacterium]|nr:DeoR/GlpR family DNA-binding transcription regulator [Candidatus Acetothermia bacterium]